MKCPKCQHENEQGDKFCRECGERLPSVCPQCGNAVKPGDRFCARCGARIVEAVSAEVTISKLEDEQHEALPDAERRQLTVVFCDIVGSTPLAEQLDPEELRNVLHDYQSVCAKVIRRFDGHIARYIGDGILVYFGYPMAHEDDAHRAVRAALGVVEGIERLSTRLQQDMGIRLAVRVGIHTGIVVAGDMDANEQLESMAIVGETPNIAARLQSIAEPNTIVMSSTTYRLTEGFFDCRSLGAHSLEGISQPVEVYRVIHESGARTRLDTAGVAGLTPLVGREQELNLLLDRWEQVKDGMGHVVLLSGEAGIGKSRMVKMLMERIAEDPRAWLTECRCSPYHQNSALYLVIDLLERVVLQSHRSDSPQERLGKLEGYLTQYGLPLDEIVPIFASLLSIPTGEGYPPLNLAPERKKQKTLQSLLTIFVERALQQPVLLVIEDLHWADASSLELLDLIVDQGPTVPILSLMTFRPEFVPPWTGRSHLTQITLNRLTRKQVMDIVDHIAGKTLPDEILQQIVAKTDGVPLFVEELTRMVLESGLLREQEDRYDLTGPLPPLAIPTTLHDSLIARLDRLATVKEVAQLGATIGREFSYEMIQSVSSLNEETLQNSLSQLVGFELLYQRGLPPQATYTFKHALIRDAAYESLLRSRRQQYHQQIAQALEYQFREIAEAQPEVLAHHYTEAGLNQQAVPYWQKAGQQAAQRSANPEAISHLERGLELLKTLPDTPEQAQQELELQAALGPSLMATRGYGVPEVKTVCTRVIELCEKLGDNSHLFRALWGLGALHLMRAELQTVREIGEQLLSIAQSLQDPSLLMPAYSALGVVLYHQGELTSSLEYLERGFAYYDPRQHGNLALAYTRDPGVQCLNYMSLALFCLGYPSKALERASQASKLVQELDHPYSMGVVLFMSSFLRQFRREGSAIQEQAEAVIPLLAEHDFPFVLAVENIFRGWVLIEQGQIDEGMELVQQEIDAYRATESELMLPHFNSFLAEGLLKAQRTEEALAILTRSVAEAEDTGQRVWSAELHRLKGETMLIQGAHEDEVEACFHKSIEIARHQQAKSWELRATVGLCRLWQKQGKVDQAQQMLQEIYDWFTEGFDTKDLQEAKALLEELSSG